MIKLLSTDKFGKVYFLTKKGLKLNISTQIIKNIKYFLFDDEKFFVDIESNKIIFLNKGANKKAIKRYFYLFKKDIATLTNTNHKELTFTFLRS